MDDGVFSAEMQNDIDGLKESMDELLMMSHDPNRADAFGRHLATLTFEEVSRWLNSQSYDADRIYHGQVFIDHPQELFKHVNCLKDMMQKPSPVYDPASNRHTNAYVVVHYVA